MCAFSYPLKGYILSISGFFGALRAVGLVHFKVKLELGPLTIKEWDTGEKHGEIGPYLAELVFWLS